jgi:hypothetical protein
MTIANDFWAIRQAAFDLADKATQLDRCHHARGIPIRPTDDRPDILPCWCLAPEGGVPRPCPDGWRERLAENEAAAQAG